MYLACARNTIKVKSLMRTEVAARRAEKYHTAIALQLNVEYAIGPPQYAAH